MTRHDIPLWADLIFLVTERDDSEVLRIVRVSSEDMAANSWGCGGVEGSAAMR